MSNVQSYNALIDRFKAFASGHFILKTFSHGQIDTADLEKFTEYPFMHVVPSNVTYAKGMKTFSFQIVLADLPRDKDDKVEFQREVLSDLQRIAEDLVAEITNHRVLFGDLITVQNVTLEPFLEEFHNTLTGWTISLDLLVPYYWDACSIPAEWNDMFESSTGGTGSILTFIDSIVRDENGNVSLVNDEATPAPNYYYGTNDEGVRGWYLTTDNIGLTCETIGTCQTIIDIEAAIDALEEEILLKADITSISAVGFSNDYNDLDNLPTIPTATSDLTNDSGFITIGDVPAQVNADWNSVSGVSEILNKPTIPAAQIQSDWTQANNVALDFIKNKPTIPAAQVNSDWNAVSGVAEILNKPTITSGTVTSVGVTAGTGISVSGGPITSSGSITVTNSAPDQVVALTAGTGISTSGTYPNFTITNSAPSSGGTVTSVALTMPSAFSVANSPVTTSGTLAVTGAGTVSQYVRGDGSLANFPSSTGGGASLAFYLNGSVAQGTFGGVAFKEMDRTPVLGAGTDFTINANGYIQSFITDANVPNQLEIPAGNWNFETYFSASSSGGTPSFYVELYKWNGTTLSLIASNSATPEGITNGTAIDAYFSALAVPQTTLSATDRLAIRIYVTHSGRTITLHTENSHLCEVITTFSTGLTALNGLTAQVQNFATGTAGTDFGISSATSTHTFNLPTASAANRGALSAADWTTFNGKQAALVSGTNIKTVNSTTLLGSGDIAVQATLVSGTNIKTINSTSLLGSGDITVGTFTLPSLTSGSVLFSNGTTIAQDNTAFNWDNTNKRLNLVSSGDNLLNLTPQASGNAIVFNNNSYIKWGTIGYTRGFSTATTFAVYNSAFTNIFNIGTTAACYVNTGSNFLIGTTTDAGYKLDVNGTARFTAQVTFPNSSNINASGNLTIGSFSLHGGSGYATFGGNVTLPITGSAFTSTSGTQIGLNYTSSFAPTSGTAIYSAFSITTTLNQTGGANGITRGLYVNPTLTAVADYRAIEVASGITILGAATTAKASLRIPSGTAPTSPVNGDIWFDGTNIKMQIGGVTKTFTLL